MSNFDNQIITDVSVTNTISNKNESIHKELFEHALARFKSETGFSNNYYSFLEHRTSDDFKKPSSVVVISKIFPYTKNIFDLSKYWDDYKFNKSYNKINNEDENLEIIDKFYTTNKALIINKYTGEEFTLEFEQCKNIPYNEEWYRFRGDLNSKSTVSVEER